MKLFQYINIYKLKVIFVGRVLLIINYLPKWRWLVVEIFFSICWNSEMILYKKMIITHLFRSQNIRAKILRMLLGARYTEECKAR